MRSANLVFPHQLFMQSPLIDNGHPVFLVEEVLLFKQYEFHKQKIVFHRATMKYYEQYLSDKGIIVNYINAHDDKADVRKLITDLRISGLKELHLIEVSDDWLNKRIRETCAKSKITLHEHPSLMFLNTMEELGGYFKLDKKKYSQTEFYISQRKKRNILVDKDQKRFGGKWSFDAENRKKYPKDKKPPAINFPTKDNHYEEAIAYVRKHFHSNPGEVGKDPIYPMNHKAASEWLHQFLDQRFRDFGPYEDAILEDETYLHHSVLTPVLNSGLITPEEVINNTIQYADDHEIPLNSLEGFIRQLIGWREFIRGIYEYNGISQRTKNFWNFDRKIPTRFYNGETGIIPLDTTIKRVLKTGYCHHIERLMVLGNFMLLCEFDPDEVYRWFMELFVDAYDWVMVPNVYGMSQFADNGMMATKPYISGSNYLMKMSNYPKGPWQRTWDALFWRFMHVHRDFFLKNPRLGMLVRSFDKMPQQKQQDHIDTANDFLSKLDR